MTKPSIELKHVSLDYPVLDPSLSFRRELLSSAFGKFMPSRKRNIKVVRALSDISLSLEEGDRLGLVGPNGAGKSTLLRLMAGTYAPSTGSCRVTGHASTLFTTGVGMDTDESGYDNITTCCLLLGMSHQEIEDKREEIIAFTNLQDYIYMPVRTYSAGMMVRLSFGIATAIDPDILLIDEIIGTGDAQFAKKATERTSKLMEKSKLLVIATHSNEVIKSFCNKGVFLQGGAIRYFGEVNDAISAYQSWIGKQAA
jgi:ABC-type polysaccharide/polyol phosphate transport system ATPase subunit